MKYAYKQKNSNKNQSNSIIEHGEKEYIRLNKYISSSGFCSRREADRYIEEGKVTVDGATATVGTKVKETQSVCVSGMPIRQETNSIYIALNKPVGITCTTDTNIEGNITTFMNQTDRIFPIGRLDKDSCGLILLTNDGDIVNKILRSTYEHEKIYVVHVHKTITNDMLTNLRNGVKIYNPVSNQYQITKKCKIEKIGTKSFKITLTEGLNRQIRRMCTSQGLRVTSLKRIQIMNVHLDDLNSGEWRYLNTNELMILNDTLKKSNT